MNIAGTLSHNSQLWWSGHVLEEMAATLLNLNDIQRYHVNVQTLTCQPPTSDLIIQWPVKLNNGCMLKDVFHLECVSLHLADTLLNFVCVIKHVTSFMISNVRWSELHIAWRRAWTWFTIVFAKYPLVMSWVCDPKNTTMSSGHNKLRKMKKKFHGTFRIEIVSLGLWNTSPHEYFWHTDTRNSGRTSLDIYAELPLD